MNNSLRKKTQEINVFISDKDTAKLYIYFLAPNLNISERISRSISEIFQV